MRLHRLVLEHYRGVEWADVAFAPTGVTIVEGDNEAGKTSLAEAIDLVLSVRDDSKSQRVRAVQPVGEDVGPEVTLDLTSGPYRFVLHKRWLRRPETTLEVLEPAPERHTGREAHDRAAAILAETLDVDLWRALRLEQGADAGLAGFNVPTLGRVLDASAGGEHGGDREDALWERIVAERDAYWTPTGRPSAERDKLARRLEGAEEAVRAVEAELRQIEADTDEMARLIAESVELAARQRELEEQAEQAAARADEVEDLEQQLARQESQLEALAASRDRQRHLVAARADLVASVELHRGRLAAAEEALERAEPEKAAIEARRAGARERRDAAHAAAQVADEAHRRADADLDFRRQEIEVEQLGERHARVLAHQAAQVEAEAILDAVTVDDAAVAAIEVAHLQVVRAEAALSAGAAALSVTALADTTIELDGAEQPLVVGEVHEATVAERASLIVPGVLRVDVRAGAEAQVLAERLAAATAALGGLCERHGVADLAAAREAAGRRAAAERTLADVAQRVQDDLRDLSTDELGRKIERLRARVAAYETDRPAEPPLPADHEAAKAAARVAEAASAAARSTLTDADAALAQAVTDSTDAEVAHAGLHAGVTVAQQALAQAEAVLVAARAEVADADLAEALAAAEAAHDHLAEQVGAARRAIERHDPRTVAALLANSQQARERGRADIAANRDRRQRLEAALETKGEQGLAHRHDEALSLRARLQRERERLEARAAAARLLHDTFEARRAEAHARYVTPFRSAIERLGRVVFGDTLAVELDADLRVAARTVDGVALPFDQLSTGAREQLGILARLACATIVAGDDGAPVLLDDSLGWTDPTRLAQMAAAIGVAGGTCQVILLTCTPGRFAGVGGARTVRLEAGGTAPPQAEGADRHIA